MAELWKHHHFREFSGAGDFLTAFLLGNREESQTHRPMTTSAQPSRYPEIEVSRTPRELGRQIGEATREEFRGFCSIALERVNKTVRISRKRAFEFTRQSLPFAEKYRPDLVDELRGTAEASGVTLDNLMLLQVRNQLAPESDAACTSFAFRSSSRKCVVAQTWDNDPALDEFTVVLTRRPAGRQQSRVRRPG